MPAPDRFCIRRNDLFLSVHYDIGTRETRVIASSRPFARLFDTREEAKGFRDIWGRQDDEIEIY